MIEPHKVERFLSDLFQADGSIAMRAYSAYFIKTHREDIEKYIEGRVAISGANYSTVTWAKKVKKLLKKYRTRPRGYAYDPHRGTLESLYSQPLRSFRLSPTPRRSLTLAYRHQLARLAGYLASCALIVVVLWLGFYAKQAIEDFGEHWILRIESLMED